MSDDEGGGKKQRKERGGRERETERGGALALEREGEREPECIAPAVTLALERGGEH